ncbi:polysaccharide deacetylase family protein [Halonotius roseus]|nr:polysaccharide deacetylase family protein [Halonotius roseus]
MAGTVVISLDAELSWGFHDQPTMPADRVANPRAAWAFLLRLFDEYEIPATWAVVGHLCLASCDGEHADHPAGTDWFARDPGGHATPRSAWFAPELVETIGNRAVDHEIGLHAFSHVEFGAAETSRAVADAELRQGLAAATAIDASPSSFVFPRNNVGHRDRLAAHGLTCYRGRQPRRWYDLPPLPAVDTAGKLATFALGLSGPPIVEPRVDEHGLVNIPASLFLFSFGGRPRDMLATLGGDPVVRQVERGLAALRTRPDGVLHLWLHPNNITTQQDRIRMSEIASLIADYREEYGIGVETMGAVADRVSQDVNLTASSY